MTPLFEFTNTFDSTITIGDVVMPIHIKRLSRAEVDAMEQEWARLMTAPRGVATATGGPCPKCGASADALAEVKRIAEWEEGSTKDRLAFWETTIRECLTLDEGLIVNRGKPVTDGAGVIEVFYARKDVLRGLVAEIYVQNHLVGLLAKNSNSPRDSGTGSSPSSQARGGGRPGPTAGSVGSSSIAEDADVTDASNSSTDEPGSSGPASGATKVH